MKNTNNKYHILINKDSGGAQHIGQHKLHNLVKDSTIPARSFRFLGAEELFDTFSKLNKSGEAVLIGGGDGTIKACAQTALENKTGFGIIPLGTMNLLARDIGVSEATEKALHDYAQHVDERFFDVGFINDQLFLCCAGLGTIPEASEFREETRNDPAIISMPRLVKVVLENMEKHKRRRVHLHIDGKSKRVRSSSLVISNNSFNENPSLGIDGLKKDSLNEGKLGIYSVSPRSMLDSVRILSRLALGSWQKDPAVRSWHGKVVRVITKRSEQLVSLDGEAIIMKSPLECRIKPSALPLLVPRKSEAV